MLWDSQIHGYFFFKKKMNKGKLIKLIYSVVDYPES